MPSTCLWLHCLRNSGPLTEPDAIPHESISMEKRETITGYTSRLPRFNPRVAVMLNEDLNIFSAIVELERSGIE